MTTQPQRRLLLLVVLPLLLLLALGAQRAAAIGAAAASLGMSSSPPLSPPSADAEPSSSSSLASALLPSSCSSRANSGCVFYLKLGEGRGQSWLISVECFAPQNTQNFAQFQFSLITDWSILFLGRVVGGAKEYY
jgi:hypothetical protein